MSNDRLDVSLEDVELLEELELTMDLMVIATEHDNRLTPERIDEILGVIMPSLGAGPSPGSEQPG